MYFWLFEVFMGLWFILDDCFKFCFRDDDISLFLGEMMLMLFGDTLVGEATSLSADLYFHLTVSGEDFLDF